MSRGLLAFITLVLALSTLGLAACGDDDDGGEESSVSEEDVALDAQAKTGARVAQTAVEVYATDNGGQYSGADIDALRQIEPMLPENIELLAQPDSYEVTVSSDTGNEFTVSRDPGGTVTRSCEPAGEGGCSESGAW